MRKTWGETPIPDRVAHRAATRYIVSGNCWISTYRPASHGYSQIGWHTDGKPFGTTAHRAAWTHHRGPIAPGLSVDHACKNRLCVRPDHLRTLPNLENARRTNGWDWPLGTCRHRHAPVWWRPKGPTRLKGYCHACRMERQQKKRGTAVKSYRD